MKIQITKRISQSLLNNDEKSQLTVESQITGGSDKVYDYAQDYDQGVKLENNFSIKNVNNFVLDLAKGNTFDLDILSLINSDIAKISFVDIFCVDSVEAQRTPVRFLISIETADGSVDLGKMSSFSLVNIVSSNITKITISGLDIPTDSKAALFIQIGTSDPIA